MSRARPKREYTEKGALIRGDYRYTLNRAWGIPETKAKGQVAFVCLNPSTADGEVDDNTIKICVGYADFWGYGRMVMLNLFAYRATDPRDLFAKMPKTPRGKKAKPLDFADPDWDLARGPENTRHLVETLSGAALVVCAWGTWHHGWGAHLRKILDDLGKTAHVLALTKGGDPHHPLRLPSDLAPIPWPKPTL